MLVIDYYSRLYDPTDPVIEFAFLIGVFASFVIVFMFFQLIIMRIFSILKERRIKRFLLKWRPILIECIAARPKNTPKLANKNIHHFLGIWNDFQGTLKGESQTNLIELANRLGLEKKMLQLIKKQDTGMQITSIVTLGNLKEKTAYDDLFFFVSDPNPILSLNGAKAICLIYPKRAVPIVVAQLLKRDDWPPSHVIAMLRELGPQLLTKIFVRTFNNANDQQLLKLLPYIHTIEQSQSLPIIEKVLNVTTNPEIISACLKIYQSPKSLELIKKYTQHEQWFIRVQAASALGRLGTIKDIESLITLLSDQQWWVRYRSAKAIISLPSITIADLESIKNTTDDKFAKNILNQVIAEQA
jgi:hypothetical protein